MNIPEYSILGWNIRNIEKTKMVPTKYVCFYSHLIGQNGFVTLCKVYRVEIQVLGIWVTLLACNGWIGKPTISWQIMLQKYLMEMTGSIYKPQCDGVRMFIFINHVAAKQGDNALGSVHPSVRPSALSSAAKTNNHHYQSIGVAIVCASVISGHLRIIAWMRLIGFWLVRLLWVPFLLPRNSLTITCRIPGYPFRSRYGQNWYLDSISIIQVIIDREASKEEVISPRSLSVYRIVTRMRSIGFYFINRG